MTAEGDRTAGSATAPAAIGATLGALVRARDWSGSPLGLPEDWSESLRTTVALVLAAEAQIVLFWGPDFVALYNDAYAPTIGEKHPRALGRPAVENWTELWDDLEPLLRGVRDTGETFAAKDRPFYIERRGYGETVYFDVSYSAVPERDGSVGGVLCIVSETTERVRATAFLRESESRLRFMAELDERLREAGEAFAAMRAATSLLGRRLETSRCAYAAVAPDGDGFVIHDDYAAPGLASSAGAYSLDLFGPRAAADMRGGRTLVIRDVAGELAPDGGRDMFQAIGIRAIVCCPLVKDGRLVAMMAVHQNRPRDWAEDEIALIEAVVERCWAHVERVGAEARLRASEEFSRRVLQSSADCIKVLSREGRLEFMSEGGLCVMEVDDFRAVEGAFWPDFWPGEGRGMALAALEEARRGRTGRFQSFATTMKGAPRWWDVIVTPINRADGAPEKLLSISRDVTATREAEMRLAELNATLERQVAERTAERNQVWEMSRDLLAVMGFDGHLKAINPAWSRTLGYGQETLLARPFPEQVHPDDHAAVREVVERLRGGEPVPLFEDRLRHVDGSWRWIAWSLVPGDGEVFYASGRDVTAEKRAAAELEATQEALRQSQKMEAMGQLTGGVAHDFNNLLTPIVGALDMMERKGLGGERERRLIGGALQSAERAKTLVHRLLAFARRQPLQPVPVDVGKLVAGMAELIASTAGPQIKVAVEIADDLPPANADPNQLEMALLNLGVNARDAMPDGGSLRITATAETVPPGRRGEPRPGRYVRLSVADTGIGMDGATLARAVEPFFSTKGVGKGTGLGLSMAHGLASQLGGALTIQSRPGLGTNIELWLPRSSEPAEEAGAAGGDGPALSSGVALLVDDEELVRVSTAAMLADLGYRVVEASSAEHALALVDRGQRLDLLVTDHLMPGMTGTDLARLLRDRSPGLPVLVVSGFAETESVAPDLPRLAKPFRNDELATILGQLPARQA